MGVHNYIVMTRFFTTIGHLTAVLILFQTINNNIERGFDDTASEADKQQAYQSCMGALSFAILCFLLDLYGTLSGNSIFNGTVNLLQIFFHFIGGIFMSWLITNNWSYQALWPIVVATSLPPALSEICVIIVINAFRSSLL
jgi:Transmembrane protein